ncbi:MAG: hypothetical protein O7H39_01995 [Gammaproteobacteria bacterium]|nr:hypothetical protein [Gammaproteobacteria bacterium]
MTLLAATVAGAIETALNAAISVDSAVQTQVCALRGKTLRAEFPEIAYTFHFDDTRVRISTDVRTDVNTGPGTDKATDGASQPSVIVRGSIVAVAEALIGPGSDQVAVEGEEAVVRDFRRCFKPHLPRFDSSTPGIFAERALGAAGLAITALRSAVEGLLSEGQSSISSSFLEQSVLSDARARVSTVHARVNALANALGDTSDAPAARRQSQEPS